MNSKDLTANWNYPTLIRVGQGRVREVTHACEALAIRSPLLITDPGLSALPMTKALIEQCSEAGLKVSLFSAIKANPTGDNVSAGVKAYLAGAHDGVIAFGGGSALDAAKAVALMVGQTRPLWDFEDIGDNWQRVNVAGIAPVIAIPTTAGTGSEVGRASVITDEKHLIKRIIFHPKMMPDFVILDPELTVGLPKPITAATGMDALSHNLEAYCTTSYHPLAQGIALEGMRLIKDNLIKAVQNGNDLTARTHMLVASSMGATAFQRGLGAMHALAHPLGAIYDAHHGRLNAILMPYVLKANRTAIEDKIIHLANTLGISGGFDGFLTWVLQLRHEIGIEPCLAEIGVGREHSARIAEMAVADAASGGNPIAFSTKDYEEILGRAIIGDLG
jgi:alcohol dehydrogenase class IV